MNQQFRMVLWGYHNECPLVVVGNEKFSSWIRFGQKLSPIRWYRPLIFKGHKQASSFSFSFFLTLQKNHKKREMQELGSEKDPAKRKKAKAKGKKSNKGENYKRKGERKQLQKIQSKDQREKKKATKGKITREKGERKQQQNYKL